MILNVMQINFLTICTVHEMILTSGFNCTNNVKVKETFFILYLSLLNYGKYVTCFLIIFMKCLESCIMCGLHVQVKAHIQIYI